METKNIQASIYELLNTTDEANLRKTLTLTLPNEQLVDLDSLSKLTSEICGKNITRQYLIESAVAAYVKDFKKILEADFGIASIDDISTNTTSDFDTLIVPAHENGFKTFFENEWYWLRLGKDKLDKIKYLAVYVGAPTSAITHYAKVEKLTKYSSGYKASLSQIKKLPHPIPLGDINASYVRPNRYVPLCKLLSAKTYIDLVKFD